MLELIKERIKELKVAIENSQANTYGLQGRLLESEWILAQQKRIEEESESLKERVDEA